MRSAIFNDTKHLTKCFLFDNIDEILNCIRLQREKTPGEENKLSASRGNRLDSFERVRAVGQVVPRINVYYTINQSK